MFFICIIIKLNLVRSLLGLNLITASSTQTYGTTQQFSQQQLLFDQNAAENVKFFKYYHLEVWNASIPLLWSPLDIVINIPSHSKTGPRFTLHPHQQFKHGSLLLCSINTSCRLICGDSIKVITCRNQTWKLSVTGKARQSCDRRRWAKSLAWLSYQGKDGGKLLGEAEPSEPSAKYSPFRAVALWIVNHNLNAYSPQLLDYFAQRNY